jgi:putative SOS response-associated peptidase YedK
VTKECAAGSLSERHPHLLAKQFQLDDVADLAPRYNIAPTQDVAVVRLNPSTEKRELSMLRWGLIPFWAEDPKVGYSTINARAETVATKPSFREAFKKRRCLVVADGFYEWQRTDGQKQPYLIHLKDNSPFAFAGLWERWRKGEQAIESCSIIVTEPNAVLEPIHDRMPVILSPEDYGLGSIRRLMTASGCNRCCGPTRPTRWRLPRSE